MKKWLQRVQKYSNRWWYTPLIAVLAAVDAYVIVIPTDGLMITAVLLNAKRWIGIFLAVALGSSIGAMSLAWLISLEGLHILEKIAPDLIDGKLWLWTEQFMQNYGLWAVFFIALSPFMQHPAIALAGLTHIPLDEVAVAVFAGRGIKYCFLAWVASHTPDLLTRIWGVQDELEEVKESLPKSKRKGLS